MRYSLLSGGKRLRSILCLAACEAVGGDVAAALPFAAAIEMLHAYSLIHDDLPAMDNDAVRRGMATNHIVFGEGCAILAGDALLTEAFTLMARRTDTVSHRRVVSIIQKLGEAAGSLGMVGGQFADLQAQGAEEVSPKQLLSIHTRKTGALIRASVQIGGIVGQANPKTLVRLGVYGEKIGLAFQIADDILNIEGDAKKTGKAVGSDSTHQKATYPGIYGGVAQAKRDALRLVDDALEAVKPLGLPADRLGQIAHYMIKRQK